ncbi:MAG: thioredoxin-like domain-containing protein [Bacteroidales bacterium]
MKQTLLTILGLLSLTFLHAQSFEVDFAIQGIQSTSAYVTVFGDKDQVLVDMKDDKISIADGKFKLQGTTNTQGVIRISLSNDDRFLKMMPSGGYIPVKSSSLWVVVYPGAKFTVAGSLEGKDFIDLYPVEGTGAGENDIFAKLSSKMMPLLNEGGNIVVEMEVKKNELTAEQVAQMNKRGEEIDVQVAKIRENFISEYPSSVAALWLMEDMLIRSQIEPAALEVPLAKVDKKYNNNYFYTKVKGRVAGAKSAAVGAKCPNINGSDQFGKEFSIKDIKGKFIIIDFWGTWCGACLSGTPHMKAFRDAHADKVQIVGVANDKDVAKWKACIEKNGMNWPNVMQGKGEQDYVAKFNVQGFPTKVLVSPKGIILHRESGESEGFYKTVENLINAK